jgi:hypothetical protein
MAYFSQKEKAFLADLMDEHEDEEEDEEYE